MIKMLPLDNIEKIIYAVRGQKVILDYDLAQLYKVETGQLKRQVRRNLKRFPTDFMFQLTDDEHRNLRCQFGISSHGGHRYLPYAFTEQGVAMLSSVLNSNKAIEVNILIMRAFVRLRQIIARNKDLTYFFKELKHQVDRHDTEIGLIIRSIEKIIAVEKKPKNKIGFKIEK